MGYRINGALVVVSALGMVFVGWLVLTLLDRNIHDNPEIEANIAPHALQIIRLHGWLPVLAAPAAVCGVIMIAGRTSRAVSLALLAASSLWLATLLVAVVYAFVMFLAPLYTPVPL